jgi:hypothetical protein
MNVTVDLLRGPGGDLLYLRPDEIDDLGQGSPRR